MFPAIVPRKEHHGNGQWNCIFLLYLFSKKGIDPKVCFISINNLAFVSKFIQEPKAPQTRKQFLNSAFCRQSASLSLVCQHCFTVFRLRDLHLQNLRTVPIISNCPFVHCSRSWSVPVTPPPCSQEQTWPQVYGNVISDPLATQRGEHHPRDHFLILNN